MVAGEVSGPGCVDGGRRWGMKDTNTADFVKVTHMSNE